MNSNEFEHRPLGNVVEGITDCSELSPAELKEHLIERGYNPDALKTRIQERIRLLSRDSRLAWMQQAKINQSRLDTVFVEITSWAKKSAAEVEHAFNEVLEGRFGQTAQLKLQSAFRNASSLPVESKAAFLDEIQALMALEKDSKKRPNK